MNLYEYITANEDYFWRWEEGYEVVEIPGGNTIAYTQVLKEMIVHLQDQGLPPFGSLLLIIAAINNNAGSSIQQIKDLLAVAITTFHPFASNNQVTFAEAHRFLLTLAELPEQYKSGDRRLALLQTIFSKCHNMVSAQKAKEIVAGFTYGHLDFNKMSKVYPFHISAFEKDFKTVALLNRRFPTAQSIIKQMAEMPEAALNIEEADIDLVQEVEHKDFVDELLEDARTFQLGSLIKPLWAGFKIPISTATPSQQPFGGVSDLTNKGDFDKLLISEFAYDDLTFLSRLANNEALYLHREMPPAIDDRQRILLADVSLLSWGIPKVLTYASCIAIAKHPKVSSQSSVYAVGNKYQSLGLDNIDEIIDGLQITSNALHPAMGIDLFLKEYKGNSRPEIFLILAAEAFRQAAVQRVMSEYASLFRYVITVEATGHIAFYKYQHGVKKLLQEVTLNLEQLWKKEIKQKEKPGRQLHSDLEESDYPILFPTPQNIKTTLSANDRFFCIADHKLYMRQEAGKQQANRGFVILRDKMPGGSSFAIGYTSTQETLFLYFNPQDKQLTITNLETNERDNCAFKEWRVVATDFFFHDDSFYHLNTAGHFRIRFENAKIKVETIVQNTAELRQLKLEEEDRLRKLKHTQSRKAILKNIYSVFINNTDNLVFNEHELRFDKGIVDLKGSGFLQRSIVANAIGKGKVFEFPDKSTATVNDSGMLILESSDRNIPTIYIPSVLGASLGVATDEHFAGNDYYSRTPFGEQELTYDVILEDSGASKITVVKILKEETGLGLKECKEIVDSHATTVLMKNIKMKKARTLVNRLTGAGANARMNPSGEKQKSISTIATKEFYTNYIETFIKHIQKSCN
jgi:ribosomal protein L7/L12